MTRLTIFFTSFIFLFVISIGDADARRFGGGGSKGTFSRQMTSPPKAPSQTQAAKPATPKSTSSVGGKGLGGMLMGLAAGGLLAAMFMGGAFEGIQFFDIILIALVAGGVLLFLRSRRSQQVQPAVSGYSPANNDSFTQPASQPFIANNDSIQTSSVEGADNQDISYGAPSWFDEKSFLEGARSHFHDLQKAWDANDLSTIKDYVTPQLFKFLKEERAAQTNHVETKVHQLAVEVTNIQQLPSKVVELAIMFHGVINEGEPENSRFCEIWHLIRDMNLENAPWLIQGIEQVES